MSSLRRGQETNIGLTYRLLQEVPDAAMVTLYYEPGIQWRGWKRSVEVVAGIGINRQIKRAYLFLARNYQPGDRVMLMGYSRGAYAVRSLAGLIDCMGLLRPGQITQDALEQVYDHYRDAPRSPAARALKDALCQPDVPIRFLGVYDTVRALGLRWPGLWRVVPMPHDFHSHALGPATEIARHALALDERRDAYAPVLWDTTTRQAGTGAVQQVWFRGSHGDVGGQIEGCARARPLSNIPLVWMLAEAEAAGLPLPVHWRNRFLTDANAQPIGMNRGTGKLFFLRHNRPVGRDPSEHLHGTARGSAAARGLRLPALPRHPATPTA